MAQVGTFFGGGCAVMLFGVPRHHGEQSVLCFWQWRRSCSSERPRELEKNTKIRVGGRRGRVKAMLAQWRLCLVARDRMHNVVAVNTASRAAMGAEQGIATLTQKNRHRVFGLFPAFSWAAVPTAYFSEDSKTNERFFRHFQFPPRTWTHLG